MKVSTGISVVIPCYNELDRVKPVLDQTLKSKYVSEIIVVDDGSNIQTKEVLKSYKKINRIKIIIHKNNKGKTAALASGVAETKYNDILFIDADIKGLSYKHIDTMVDIYKRNKLEVLLGDREKELFFFKFLGLTAVWGGEKLVKKYIFWENKEIFLTKGFLFESVFMKKTLKKYRIGRHVLKDVGQAWKVEKNGLKGLTQDIFMLVSIIRLLGIRECLWQGYYCKNILKKY